MDNKLKYSLGINVVLLATCVYFYSRPADTVVVTQTQIKEVKVVSEGKKVIEWKDRIVETVRTETRYEAGATIVIHETTTDKDKGKTDEVATKKEETKVDTKTETTETVTSSTRFWLAGVTYAWTTQTPGIVAGINVGPFSPIVQAGYSFKNNDVPISVGVLVRF